MLTKGMKQTSFCRDCNSPITGRYFVCLACQVKNQKRKTKVSPPVATTYPFNSVCTNCWDRKVIHTKKGTTTGEHCAANPICPTCGCKGMAPADRYGAPL